MVCAKAIASIEARELVKASKRRRVLAPHSEQAPLEIVLPLDMETRMQNNERFSLVPAAGPRKNVDALCSALHTQKERNKWCEQARAAAILGSCSRSLPSMKSGCRCYFAFAERILGKTQSQALPPTLDELLAWSCTFRNAGTFSNYLSYLKAGTLLVGRCASVFDNDVLRRAKRSIRNRDGFKRRERMFIQMDIVRSIVMACCMQADDMKWGMLFLLSYVFLLRLPSEAIPVVRGRVGLSHNEEYANCVYMEGELLCLKLKRRKNKPQGSVLKRACWCHDCACTCPVHVLWPFFKRLNVGQAAFPGVSAGGALKQLRSVLHTLGVENCSWYRTHDLRRGHALDMQLNGSTLQQILAAGEWRSPAFMQYLSMVDLELGAVVEAHQGESSSEDET